MFGISFRTKKSVSIYLFPPPSGAMRLERLIRLLKYYIIYIVTVLKWNSKVVRLHTIYVRMQPKKSIASKKRKIASTKSCSDLNFIQKSLRAHMSILLSSPTPSGTEEVERLIWLKYLYCTETSNNTCK